MKYLILIFAIFSLASSSETNEYDCVIEYLKSINMLENYNATIPLENLTNCDEVIDIFNTQIKNTYTQVFEIHPKTEPVIECIMKNFNKSQASDYVLQKFTYEYLRNSKAIEKSIFCEALQETDAKIESEMKKSVLPCAPNFHMDSLFEVDSGAEECRK